MKVVRLSALCTDHLYPRKYSWYSFLLEAELAQSHSETRSIMSMKNTNDTIRNRSSNLPVCSAVSQPLCHHMPHINMCISPIFRETRPLKLVVVMMMIIIMIMTMTMMNTLVRHRLYFGLWRINRLASCQNW
jgi:hypothetical protein